MENRTVMHIWEEDSDEVACHKAMVVVADLLRYVEHVKKTYIEPYVLSTKASQNVAGLRATYSNPRKSYDYEAPFNTLCAEVMAMDDGDLMARIDKVVAENTATSIGYRAVCQALDLEPYVTEGEGPGSVSYKVS